MYRTKVEVAGYAAMATSINGGCTISQDGIVPHYGWAVATGGITVPDDPNLGENILRFLNGMPERVVHEGVSREAYLGTWVSEGKVYLDKVVIIKSEIEALYYAKVFNQEAIYNLENGRCLYVK